MNAATKGIRKSVIAILAILKAHPNAFAQGIILMIEPTIKIIPSEKYFKKVVIPVIMDMGIYSNTSLNRKNMPTRDANWVALWKSLLTFLNCINPIKNFPGSCLLYTSDAADDLLCVDLGGRR